MSSASTLTQLQRSPAKTKSASFPPSAHSPSPKKSPVTATCALISSTRFEIQSPYHADLIELYRNIPSRSYGKVPRLRLVLYPIAFYFLDPQKRCWNFLLRDYDLVGGCLCLTVPEKGPRLQCSSEGSGWSSRVSRESDPTADCRPEDTGRRVSRRSRQQMRHKLRSQSDGT